jgi:hypothetical protein
MISCTRMEVQDLLYSHSYSLVRCTQPSQARTAKNDSIKKIGDYSFKYEVDHLQRFKDQTSCSVKGLCELVYQDTTIQGFRVCS